MTWTVLLVLLTADTPSTCSPPAAAGVGSVGVTTTAVAAASPVAITSTVAETLAAASVTSTSHSVAGSEPQNRSR